MEYFVGIDPSMNSTGICVQKYDGDIKISEQFIILKPGDKTKNKSKWLVKKEKIAEEQLFNFQYCFYPKENLDAYKELNHFHEYWKSWNMCSCAKTIQDIVKEWTKDNSEHIYIVIEGISYGSVQRTKSIFDLAGLNYLVREKFINKYIGNNECIFTIATPSEIKKFASGNGNCKKDVMVNLFKLSHPELEIVPKIDDISDAWFMSNYARKLKTDDDL